jgi:hypothetical protein
VPCKPELYDNQLAADITPVLKVMLGQGDVDAVSWVADTLGYLEGLPLPVTQARLFDAMGQLTHHTILSGDETRIRAAASKLKHLRRYLPTERYPHPPQEYSYDAFSLSQILAPDVMSSMGEAYPPLWRPTDSFADNSVFKELVSDLGINGIGLGDLLMNVVDKHLGDSRFSDAFLRADITPVLAAIIAVGGVGDYTKIGSAIVKLAGGTYWSPPAESVKRLRDAIPLLEEKAIRSGDRLALSFLDTLPEFLGNAAIVTEVLPPTVK